MKTVLITGANRGLGLGFAQHYLERGWRVYATARAPLDDTGFTGLRQRFGDRFNAIALELTSESSIAEAAALLDDVELDLVINNAGACPNEAFGEWMADTFAQAFATNATGPALVAQALSPCMKRGATLVNLSSGLGSCGLNIEPETGLDAYAASKSALNMVTCRLAAKLAPRGIIVVACDPGWVKTRMGGPDADLTVEESIGALTTTIENLAPADSGRFLSRHGDEVPW